MKTQSRFVWPYLLLSVSLLGAMGFGWYQTRLKNQLALDNENKYMSAFHKLKWTSENIEERTARLMASNDMHNQESLLADLRVFSAQAVEHMAILPFSTLNTPQIENFLNTVRIQSDVLHDKLNRGEPLSTQEWEQLKGIRQQSVQFEQELGRLLGLVGGHRLRWSDTVRATGMAQNGNATTPITESVVNLDRALQPPPGQQQATAPAPLPRPKIDPGAPVDQTAAAQSIKRFIDTPLNGEPVMTGRSDPGDQQHALSLYFFNAQKANGTPLAFGVSIHGGHVIYMIDGRPVTTKNFTHEQLIAKSKQMLKQWKYPEVDYVSRVENDGTLVMDFAPVENGVAIQTELIKISLAMDNSELVAFDARSYWINRHVRNNSAPQLPADEAQRRVSPRLKVESKPRLSLVANRRDQEKLVWEMNARYDDQVYRVFIDANTGEEVAIERVAGDPAPPMSEGTTTAPK